MQSFDLGEDGAFMPDGLILLLILVKVLCLPHGLFTVLMMGQAMMKFLVSNDYGTTLNANDDNAYYFTGESIDGVDPVTVEDTDCAESYI